MQSTSIYTVGGLPKWQSLYLGGTFVPRAQGSLIERRALQVALLSGCSVSKRRPNLRFLVLELRPLQHRTVRCRQLRQTVQQRCRKQQIKGIRSGWAMPGQGVEYVNILSPMTRFRSNFWRAGRCFYSLLGFRCFCPFGVVSLGFCFVFSNVALCFSAPPASIKKKPT